MRFACCSTTASAIYPWWRAARSSAWCRCAAWPAEPSRKLGDRLGLFALRRYVPYLRPYVGLVVVFGLSQLGSLVTAASIPKVIQFIIDGPITEHNLGRLVPMAGLLVVIGALGFVLIVMRRQCSCVALLCMDTDLRNDFYAHLQNLQVSFHDNGNRVSSCHERSPTSARSAVS